MEKAALERYLSRQIWTQRLVLTILAVILFAVGFLGNHLLETSRELGQREHERLYVAMVCAGMCGGMLPAVGVFTSFLRCRFKSIYKGQQYLTAYRGLLFIIVYVDGVEKARSIALHECMLLEVWLAERVKATVHFTNSALNLAHISFSDHTATIEIE